MRFSNTRLRQIIRETLERAHDDALILDYLLEGIAGANVAGFSLDSSQAASTIAATIIKKVVFDDDIRDDYLILDLENALDRISDDLDDIGVRSRTIKMIKNAMERLTTSALDTLVDYVQKADTFVYEQGLPSGDDLPGEEQLFWNREAGRHEMISGKLPPDVVEKQRAEVETFIRNAAPTFGLEVVVIDAPERAIRLSGSLNKLVNFYKQLVKRVKPLKQSDLDQFYDVLEPLFPAYTEKLLQYKRNKPRIYQRIYKLVMLHKSG